MKKSIHPLLAAAIGVCLAVPAFASVPSTSAELKKPQAEHQAKGKKKAGKSAGKKAPKQA